jgi:hypothetical protein
MLDNLPRYAQGSRGQAPMRYGPREAARLTHFANPEIMPTLMV